VASSIPRGPGTVWSLPLAVCFRADRLPALGRPPIGAARQGHALCRVLATYAAPWRAPVGRFSSRFGVLLVSILIPPLFLFPARVHLRGTRHQRVCELPATMWLAVGDPGARDRARRRGSTVAASSSRMGTILGFLRYRRVPRARGVLHRRTPAFTTRSSVFYQPCHTLDWLQVLTG